MVLNLGSILKKWNNKKAALNISLLFHPVKTLNTSTINLFFYFRKEKFRKIISRLQIFEIGW